MYNTQILSAHSIGRKGKGIIFKAATGNDDSIIGNHWFLITAKHSGVRFYVRYISQPLLCNITLWGFVVICIAILNAIDYSVHWGNTTDTLSPGHTVLQFPPHLNQAQPCPLLYIVQPLSCWPSLQPFPFNVTLPGSVCHGSFRSHHMSKSSELYFLNDLRQLSKYMQFCFNQTNWWVRVVIASDLPWLSLY